MPKVDQFIQRVCLIGCNKLVVELVLGNPNPTNPTAMLLVSGLGLLI